MSKKKIVCIADVRCEIENIVVDYDRIEKIGLGWEVKVSELDSDVIEELQGVDGVVDVGLINCGEWYEIIITTERAYVGGST